ncbi:MAG: 2-oxoacid:acceptor oxidoreductase family protein [Euryarchaeota archaeon]|nr:2-oxoacid:acceptor oxidoreductase family protein [Euryarchaeota archaeon]
MAASTVAALPGGRGLFEVRFHGRGGQGTVVASILLAQAAFLEGRGVQAFPFFGVERRGAPVLAHTRIGEGAVRLACAVDRPDAVVVMDPSLVGGLGRRLLDGVRDGGVILLNSRRPPPAAMISSDALRVHAVDASSIAVGHGLGSPSNPIVNTAILGALAKATGIVSIESLERSIRYKAPARIEENVAAAHEAYESLVVA